MIALLLWVLATIDSAFIGYREAAGRCALIDKRAYYRQSMIRGALFGQAAVMLVGSVTAAMLYFAPNPLQLLQDIQVVGARMLTIYIPYALILLFTFLVRATPSVDLRSITSVLIFGPLTLLRPLVVVAGALWGAWAAPGPAILVLVALIISLMLSLEWVIGKLRERGLFAWEDLAQ